MAMKYIYEYDAFDEAKWDLRAFNFDKKWLMVYNPLRVHVGKNRETPALN